MRQRESVDIFGNTRLFLRTTFYLRTRVKLSVEDNLSNILVHFFIELRKQVSDQIEAANEKT